MANTVKLQGIYGEQPGTPTKDLKIGDVILWNGGYKSEVVEIIPSKTGKTITFMLKSHQDGEIRSRKMGADRLVVLGEKAQEKQGAISEAREAEELFLVQERGRTIAGFTSTDDVRKYLWFKTLPEENKKTREVLEQLERDGKIDLSEPDDIPQNLINPYLNAAREEARKEYQVVESDEAPDWKQPVTLAVEGGRPIAVFLEPSDAETFLRHKKEVDFDTRWMSWLKPKMKETNVSSVDGIPRELREQASTRIHAEVEARYSLRTMEPELANALMMSNQMPTYAEMKKQHQEELNKFPLGAAFSNQQFEEMMRKWGLDAKEKSDLAKVTHLCEGAYMQKKDVPAYNEMMRRHRAELEAAIAADATGDGFIREMFYTELVNNEYGYPGSYEDTLSALGYTPEDIQKDSRLAHGLSAAAHEIRAEEEAVWEPAEKEAVSEAMEAEELPEMAME